jgi:hypothetical protein
MLHLPQLSRYARLSAHARASAKMRCSCGLGGLVYRTSVQGLGRERSGRVRQDYGPCGRGALADQDAVARLAQRLA